MIKLVQVTDTHLAPPGQLVQGLDPGERLQRVLAHVAQQHGDAAAVVLTGDLVDAGDAASYDHLHNILAACPLRLHLGIGNHDDRAQFAEVFPAHAAADGFVHQRIELGDGDVALLLDTVQPGTHAGLLCAQRLRWLETQLTGCTGRALLFLHHAPMLVGLRGLDRVPLQNGDTLRAVLEPYRLRIAHLSFGHMHRAVAGSWAGFPFTVVPGTNQHNRLDLNAETSVRQPMSPGYAVFLCEHDQVIVHIDYLPAE